MGSSKGGNNIPSDQDLTDIGGPWKPLEETLKNRKNEAVDIYGRSKPWQYGPNVVAPFNPAQNMALQGMIGLAGQGMGGGMGGPTGGGGGSIAGSAPRGGGGGAQSGMDPALARQIKSWGGPAQGRPTVISSGFPGQSPAGLGGGMGNGMPNSMTAQPMGGSGGPPGQMSNGLATAPRGMAGNQGVTGLAQPPGGGMSNQMGRPMAAGDPRMAGGAPVNGLMPPGGPGGRLPPQMSGGAPGRPAYGGAMGGTSQGAEANTGTGGGMATQAAGGGGMPFGPSAGDPTGLTGAANTTAGIASGQGIGAAPGSDFLASLASRGAQSPATGAYQQLMGRAMGGSGGLGMIQGTAGGNMVGSNPYLDAQVNNVLGDIGKQFSNTVMPSINNQLSQSGRLGGDAQTDLYGTAQGQLAQQMGQAATGIRMQDYQNERAMQQQAQLALPGAFGQEIQTGLAGAGGAAGNYFNGLQAQLQGAQQAGQGYRGDVDQALQAANQMGNVYNARYLPYQQMMSAGSTQQAQQERMNQEAHDRFSFNQQEQDWGGFNRYMQALGSIQGMTNSGQASAYAAQQAGNAQHPSLLGNLAGAAGLIGGIVAAPYTGGGSLGYSMAGLNQLAGR